MQATSAAPQPRPSSLARNLSWFLVAPVTAAVLLSLLLVIVLALYQQRHADRIFTGVTVWGVDLSGMDRAEAEQRLSNAFTYPQERAIVLNDPTSGEEWVLSPAELGLTFDMEATAEAAYRVGRHGGPIARLGELFNGWYFGWNMAPVVVLDEGALDQALADISEQINRPASDASLTFDGTSVGYAAAQVGRSLDEADAKARTMATLSSLRQGQIQLLVHETQPRVHDTSQAAQQIEQIISGPMTLYLQEPLAGDDLNQVTVPADEIVKWIRVQTVENAQGQATTKVIIDENAVRAWLAPYQEMLKRDPVNARYYFDDDTRELVLVEPHVSGRALDLDATVKQFVEQLTTPARSMPFVLQEIVPTVHSGATAAELGITELVSESTTWFYGSSDERKHNIARAASNFYGIVIAPGQEFSFNQYLGDVSEEEGYETGLIIFGGRTIEGVGGGVCQVSTTAFQAAFWAGYPIVECWEHGY
ncbi:MAG: VanW family protein [Candidatus Promineifilaceae bacterium]